MIFFLILNSLIIITLVSTMIFGSPPSLAIFLGGYSLKQLFEIGSTKLEKVLSIDIFDAKVSSKVVRNRGHVVNNVSGGRLDPNMFSTVADLGVPYILMHMRGQLSTMQNDENTTYGDVCNFFLR